MTVVPPTPDIDRAPAGASVPVHGFSLLDLLALRQPRLVVTPAIVAIDVALFAAMTVQSGHLFFPSDTLVAWGGLFPPAVARGEWWRLLSAMWLHGHPLHLFLNLVFLWQLGAILERMLGPRVFAIVYLLAGVLATAVSLQTLRAAGVSVGASGAIFGLVGVLFAVAIASRRIAGLAAMMADLRMRLVTVIVVNLAAGFALPGIDNGAHVGGLVAGIGLGWLIARDSVIAAPPLRRTLLPAVLTVAVAAGSVAALGRGVEPLTLAGEQARFDAFNAPAEARFRTALADARGLRAGAAAADALEQAVVPALREAQHRGDLRLRQTGAALRAPPAGGANRGARERDYYDAHQWAVFLARYDEAWRLRIGGLRDGDAARMSDGDSRAARARRLFANRWKRPQEPEATP